MGAVGEPICLLGGGWIAPLMHPTIPEGPRAEVTTAIGCTGGSWRWRTEPLNCKSQPACNVMRRLLIFLPASNKQTHRVKIRAIPALAVSSSPATRPFAWPARPNLASQIHRIQAPFRRTAARPGPQLRCERVSPTRFSLTGAAFSYGAPAERSVREHEQGARCATWENWSRYLMFHDTFSSSNVRRKIVISK